MKAANPDLLIRLNRITESKKVPEKYTELNLKTRAAAIKLIIVHLIFTLINLLWFYQPA